MFLKDNAVKLPSKHIKFDIIEDSKLELLVNQRGDDEFYHRVCQDVLEVLEIIMGSPPNLTGFDEFFVTYAFETRNRLWVLDISLNR